MEELKQGPVPMAVLNVLIWSVMMGCHKLDSNDGIGFNHRHNQCQAEA
jgi:hypothetical protein